MTILALGCEIGLRRSHPLRRLHFVTRKFGDKAAEAWRRLKSAERRCKNHLAGVAMKASLLLLLPAVSALHHFKPSVRSRLHKPSMQYGQQQYGQQAYYGEQPLYGQQPYGQQQQQQQQSFGMQAIVQHTFEASRQGELSIYPGDVIENVVQAEQDWWSGELRGQSGWFPANCVVMMNGNGAGVRDPRADEAIMHISERLREPQIRIVRAVVDFLGTEAAYELLAATEDVQARGGMIVPDTGRPRTSGGIFYRLLKEATHLPRDAQQAALRRIKEEGKRVKSWEKAAAW